MTCFTCLVIFLSGVDMFAMWLSSYQYVKPLDRMRDGGNHSLGSWDRESGEGSARARGPPQSHSHLRQAGMGGRKNITNDATNERTNGLGNWDDADGTRTRKPVSRPPLFKVTPLSTEFTLSSRGLDHQRSTLRRWEEAGASSWREIMRMT